MQAGAAPQLDRSDRYVRRSYLRIADEASRGRIASHLKEALRLVSLPGEDEGRVYYFRRVTVSGIPLDASRTFWIDRLEHTLLQLADHAVHASDPRACAAEAVYFHNHLEALELLLHQVIRGDKVEWFWSAMMGRPVESRQAMPVVDVLELLHQQPLPPGIMAATIFSALGSLDPVALLSPIPTFVIREWLRAMDRSSGMSSSTLPVTLSQRRQTALQQAAHHFGWSDPKTVWLAGLAVLELAPAASTGTAAQRARSTLRWIEMTEARESSCESAASADNGDPRDQQAIVSRAILFDDDVAAEPTPLRDLVSESVTSLLPAKPKSIATKPAEHERSAMMLGEPTSAAGLYFLLNALRHLGLPTALQACPELAECGIVEGILRALAARAGVMEGDPILCCLMPDTPPSSLSSETLAKLPLIPQSWPASLRHWIHRAPTHEAFLRTWALGGRQWCWRMGSITVRDIINREGHVWLTRTDLDVTLPLDKADIRIRRIGLDIDPGWLPWFGRFGRVVRFHYRDHAPGGIAC